MANRFDRQILEEGHRNALVKFTGTLDTSDAVLAPAISLGDFLNNDPTMTSLRGLRVDLVEWSMSDGLEIMLEWNGTIPQQITPIAGRGKIMAMAYGGMIPDFARTGYDGNINLRTNGFSSVEIQQLGGIGNYTVMLELVKLYNR